jgi:hypothetical protein
MSAWQAFGQIPYNYKGQWQVSECQKDLKNLAIMLRFLNKWVYNNIGNAYIRCFYFTAAVATSTGNNPSPTNVVEYIYMT